MSNLQLNTHKEHGTIEPLMPLMQSNYQTHENDGNNHSSNDDDTDSSSSQPDEEDQNWIPWFCSTKGNDFFCEVERVFIEDSFNLFGIKQDFPFDIAVSLAIILDKAEYEEENSHEQGRAAELLYGMLHARFLLSSQGLIAMHQKFVAKGFGECPRTCCNGQAALPVGLSDEVGMTPVKLFCPRCRDIYNCPTQRHVDGAFFGTTFPHLFLMTFENLVPTAPTHHYVPRVFGFRIHPSSSSIAKVDSGDRLLQNLSLPSSHAQAQGQSHVVQPLLQPSSQPLSVSEVCTATAAAGVLSTSKDDDNNRNKNSARQANNCSNNSSSTNARETPSFSRAAAAAAAPTAMEVDGDEEVVRVEQERLSRPRASSPSAASSSRTTRNRSSMSNNSHAVVSVSSSGVANNDSNSHNLQILSEVSATQEQQQHEYEHEHEQQQQQPPVQKKARKS